MRGKLGVKNAFSVLWSCAAVGALAVGGPAAQAASQCESVAGNLVLNCGFENRGPQNRPTDWSTGGPNGVAISLPFSQRTGDRSLAMNFDAPGTSFASQAVGGAGTYNVSFWLDSYTGGVASTLVPSLSVTFGDQTLNVTLPVNNTQNQNYIFFQFNNVTTAAAAALMFQTSGSVVGRQYLDLLIDDVVVTSVTPAVPEPSSMAMGLSGLAGLALWRRRQQRGAAAAQALRRAAAPGLAPTSGST